MFTVLVAAMPVLVCSAGLLSGCILHGQSTRTFGKRLDFGDRTFAATLTLAFSFKSGPRETLPRVSQLLLASPLWGALAPCASLALRRCRQVQTGQALDLPNHCDLGTVGLMFPCLRRPVPTSVPMHPTKPSTRSPGPPCSQGMQAQLDAASDGLQSAPSGLDIEARSHGRCWLVGAGPGDADLLTVRERHSRPACRCLPL